MQDCKNYENERGRELDFKTLSVQHSGIYTCKISISHEGKLYHSTNTIRLVVEEGKKTWKWSMFSVFFTVENVPY